MRLQAFAISQRGGDLAQLCAPAAETWIKLERFWKSYTPSGEEKRAVREVGSTWLGPAQ
jgi:hypothetical protein